MEGGIKYGDIPKRVQAAYNQMVEAFAKRNHGQMPENLIALAQGLIWHTGKEAQIVDVGCGTGRDMAWFESDDIKVTGIDISSEMLKFARGSVTGNLLMMDMRKLAFRSGFFDGVWCVASMLHLPKIEAPCGLGEIRRIMKLDGMLILSIQEGTVETWEDRYVKGVKCFYARYSVDEMKTLLSDSNFTVCKINSEHARNQNWLSFVCIAN